jgi:hypothetical protein
MAAAIRPETTGGECWAVVVKFVGFALSRRGRMRGMRTRRRGGRLKGTRATAGAAIRLEETDGECLAVFGKVFYFSAFKKEKGEGDKGKKKKRTSEGGPGDGWEGNSPRGDGRQVS